MAKGRGRGRPQKYKKHFAVVAYRLCTYGYTDKELALALGVSKSTINRWKHDHADFWDSLKRGKLIHYMEIRKAL